MEHSDHYSIPGGRLALHEDVETAVLREVREELGAEGRILRPLWMNQCFYQSDFRETQVHEISLYFLVNVNRNDLSGTCERFVHYEGEKCHRFRWIPIEKVATVKLYPRFLRKGIRELPLELTLLAERES
jgi:ADP-ribose pyrophosphatase YjhB (NUDIX family)